MKRKKLILSILGVLILGGTALGWYIYNKAFQNNINPDVKGPLEIFVPTGSTFNNLIDSLRAKQALKDYESFETLAKYKGLDEKTKPGRYIIQPGMSNNALVNMFMSGRQSPVKITFNNIRTRQDFADRIGSQLECGPEAILDQISDEAVAARFGLNKDNFIVIFIPNTYEMYWTTSAEEFVEKMHSEYEKFWTPERKSLAEKAGLSQVEVSILASIVQGESNKTDEMDEIAGLYINRLKKGWKLEADPTVKYAVGDFSLKRILKKHCETESPYNTYLHEGLPPGPINFPDPVVIDQVLHHAKHNFMFMCAKEDFSGYHNFAVTNAQHEANARKYQAAFRELERKKRAKQSQ